MKVILVLLVSFLLSQETLVARELTKVISIRNGQLTNETLDIKRRLELSAGITIDMDAELIEIVLVNANSLGRNGAKVELDAGFYDYKMVMDRPRDWVFGLSEAESKGTIGRSWDLIVRGRVLVSEIEVTIYNPGCAVNCGDPDELELVRYEKKRGDDDFRVTSETVRDRDYFFDERLGYILSKSVREPDTKLLFECYTAGRDYFLSASRNCEGQRSISTLGRIYINPGQNTLPLYRCFDGAKHSASTFEDCEGLGRNEHLLGYILL